MKSLPLVACVSLVASLFTPAALAAEWLSHPPMRPLPTASERPMPTENLRFIDATKGLDTNSGTRELPWQTLQFALGKLQPGDTLVLRGGTYYEHPVVRAKGTAEKPITIRAQQGELAIIDGGWRDFTEHPEAAWEPCPDGVAGEYQSTKTYPSGGGFGNFGDSMVPLHRYITVADLRSTNEYWRPEFEDRADVPGGIYCGPGVRRAEDGRIHVRLAHTQLEGLGDNAYRGETDPRKVPLVIAGDAYTLAIEGGQHIRVQDVVVRGAKTAAVKIENAAEIDLDGVTLYGGMMALRTGKVNGLRLLDCALRGHAAPWHSRAHHKYRAGSGYLLNADGDRFELARCELTDNHDLIAMATVENLSMHHCFLENFNDDGIEPGPKRARGRILIYQNYLSRVLSPFTAHGKNHQLVDAEPGSGVYIYRNLIDLRYGTYRSIPAAPDASGAFLDAATEILAHDHGSPVHPIYYVYQNTILLQLGPWRNLYDFTWGSATGDTTRRVYNNIFGMSQGGLAVSFVGTKPADDFQSDHNLTWSLSPQTPPTARPFPRDLGLHDQFTDPKLASWLPDRAAPLDARLTAESPARHAGFVLPAEWPDPVRMSDRSSPPDLGAIPFEAKLWGAGVHERIPVFPHTRGDGAGAH